MRQAGSGIVLGMHSPPLSGARADGSPTWIEAQVLPSMERLKDHTVHMLLVRLKHDEYACVLPISSDTAFANLSRRGPDDSRLAINLRGASHKKKGHAAVVVARTHNERYIAALPRVAITEGRKWLFREPIAYQPLRPGPFDGVGFCTWNALEEGMLRCRWMAI